MRLLLHSHPFYSTRYSVQVQVSVVLYNPCTNTLQIYYSTVQVLHWRLERARESTVRVPSNKYVSLRRQLGVRETGDNEQKTKRPGHNASSEYLGEVHVQVPYYFDEQYVNENCLHRAMEQSILV